MQRQLRGGSMKKTNKKINLGILILLATISLGFLVSCSTIGGFFGRLFFDGTETQIAKDGDMKEFFANVRPGRGNPEAYYQLGKHYQERNLHLAAVKEFQKVVYLNPAHAMALNRLGISYDLLGKYDEAVGAYREALKIDANLDFVYNNLGYSYLLKGDVQEAVKAFKSAIALNGQKEIYHNNLGLALAKVEQYDLALQEFKVAGDEAKAYYNLANQYYEQEKYEEAQKNYQTALDLKPTMTTARKRMEASEALARISKTSAERQEGNRVTVAIAPKTEPNNTTPGQKPADQDVSGATKNMRADEVEISNGNGVNNMARLVKGFLTENNFRVVRLTNAEHFNHEESQIFYKKGYQNTAEQINQEVPVAIKQKEVKKFDRPHIKVKLLIGKDVVPHKSVFENRNQQS
jgi:tetratricopeptide (TPR) repeat protein